MFGCCQADIGVLGGLVAGVEAGEILDQALPGLLVEAFGIARLADLDGGVDEDLEELARPLK